jgi:hypothetical protein
MNESASCDAWALGRALQVSLGAGRCMRVVARHMGVGCVFCEGGQGRAAARRQGGKAVHRCRHCGVQIYMISDELVLDGVVRGWMWTCAR